MVERAAVNRRFQVRALVGEFLCHGSRGFFWGRLSRLHPQKVSDLDPRVRHQLNLLIQRILR